MELPKTDLETNFLNLENCSFEKNFDIPLLIKVIKSVDIAKSWQRYDKTLNNFLLHVPNHTLKDMYMLNYGIINNMNCLYYGRINKIY